MQEVPETETKLGSSIPNEHENEAESTNQVSHNTAQESSLPPSNESTESGTGLQNQLTNGAHDIVLNGDVDLTNIDMDDVVFDTTVLDSKNVQIIKKAL